ncbi:MAG: glycogen debranching enzyme N-terminal domain-containing protein, partial [Candidatus Omnitrophica bacterium]|nr:glycogen debranching enzyme N-terminal domain-containing protein [Candidatus Omnitrophota bacterium]
MKSSKVRVESPLDLPPPASLPLPGLQALFCNIQECPDFDRLVAREWIVTNGLGGYASSTVIGMNTRRTHGLLVAATHPPVGRAVLLSKVEET